MTARSQVAVTFASRELSALIDYSDRRSLEEKEEGHMRRIQLLAFVGFLSASLLPGLAQAERKWISDPVQISNILHAIPAIGGDLGGRLAAAGLRVKSISLDPISRDDVAEDPHRWAIGDIEVSILTEGEPLSGDCSIMGQPTFINRHGKYLPQDRTGMWLLTGKCEVPN